MILKAIARCFQQAKEKNWDKTYWAVDIHGTSIVPNYQGGDIPKEFYPYACETLQLLSSRDDIVLILFTCSYPNEIEEYLDYFRSFNIHFKYSGKNPEVDNGEYGYFRDKPYFNVLFEDKAGFDPGEWPAVLNYLKEYWKLN
jgi:hypothetical protein